jgi:hypothetical protein
MISGAIFMAASYELPIARKFLSYDFGVHCSNPGCEEQHDIARNGWVSCLFSLNPYAHTCGFLDIVIIWDGTLPQNPITVDKLLNHLSQRLASW